MYVRRYTGLFLFWSLFGLFARRSVPPFNGVTRLEFVVTRLVYLYKPALIMFNRQIICNVKLIKNCL